MLDRHYDVLLIEDDPVYAELLRAYFQQAGLTLHVARSLIDLSPIASIQKFDLVVLDQYLEYLSGLEIAKFINELAGDFLVILVSSDDRIVSSLPPSIKEFFHKNRPPAELVQRCLELLKRSAFIKNLI